MVVATREPAKTQPRVAMLAGASGLTGSALLRLLLDDENYGRVLALSRRPLPLEHARLANRILPRFDDLSRSLKGQRCTDAFCTLGAAGGPRAAESQLREVDLQLVLDFARTAQELGATRLVVISAAGAQRNASTAFLRVKGEMEAALRALKFSNVDVLQPGVVYGPRRGESIGDTLRHGVLALASPLLRRSNVGPEAISSARLAGAMLAVARSQRRGFNNYSGPGLASLSAATRRIP